MNPSDPMRAIRDMLVEVGKTLDDLRKFVKRKSAPGGNPDRPHADHWPPHSNVTVETVGGLLAEWYEAHDTLNESLTMANARLTEARAHLAVANKALATIIRLKSPKEKSQS